MMSLLINVLIAMGIVVAVYSLLILGLWAIYSLGFGGRLADLGLSSDIKGKPYPRRRRILAFAFYVFVPVLIALFALYLSLVGRIIVAVIAACVICAIWLFVAFRLKKIMKP